MQHYNKMLNKTKILVFLENIKKLSFRSRWDNTTQIKICRYFNLLVCTKLSSQIHKLTYSSEELRFGISRNNISFSLYGI
jgi:hypothetical protein